MPADSVKWSDFLTNGENKNDLMLLFQEFLKTNAINKCDCLSVIICCRTGVYEVGSFEHNN